MSSLFQWLTVAPQVSSNRTVTRSPGSSPHATTAECSIGSRSHTSRRQRERR
ncbi:MAG: hypothetical protein R2711_15110 [Acidimicrobiales bacterium]